MKMSHEEIESISSITAATMALSTEPFVSERNGETKRENQLQPKTNATDNDRIHLTKSRNQKELTIIVTGVAAATNFAKRYPKHDNTRKSCSSILTRNRNSNFVCLLQGSLTTMQGFADDYRRNASQTATTTKTDDPDRSRTSKSNRDCFEDLLHWPQLSFIELTPQIADLLTTIHPRVTHLSIFIPPNALRSSHSALLTLLRRWSRTIRVLKLRTYTTSSIKSPSERTNCDTNDNDNDDDKLLTTLLAEITQINRLRVLHFETPLAKLNDDRRRFVLDLLRRLEEFYLDLAALTITNQMVSAAVGNIRLIRLGFGSVATLIHSSFEHDADDETLRERFFSRVAFLTHSRALVISPNELRTLCGDFRNLSSLSISLCDEISLREFAQSVTYLPHLAHLHLCRANFNSFAAEGKIGGGRLRHLRENSKQSQNENLSHCITLPSIRTLTLDIAEPFANHGNFGRIAPILSQTFIELRVLQLNHVRDSPLCAKCQRKLDNAGDDGDLDHFENSNHNRENDGEIIAGLPRIIVNYFTKSKRANENVYAKHYRVERRCLWKQRKPFVEQMRTLAQAIVQQHGVALTSKLTAQNSQHLQLSQQSQQQRTRIFRQRSPLIGRSGRRLIGATSRNHLAPAFVRRWRRRHRASSSSSNSKSPPPPPPPLGEEAEGGGRNLSGGGKKRKDANKKRNSKRTNSAGCESICEMERDQLYKRLSSVVSTTPLLATISVNRRRR